MRVEQTPIVPRSARHAVVIGASMAGLLAAYALSPYFERVTIVERDSLASTPQPRKGVPQGQHVHLFLRRGTTILASFFPDLFSTLETSGSTRFDPSADLGWFHFGAWKARFKTELDIYSQSRYFLEWHVKAQVFALGNVDFIDRAAVTGITATDDKCCVTGVIFERSAAETEGRSQPEQLAADLVVDASGRGSQAPRWLTLLGYSQVQETNIKMDLGYTTRLYRRPQPADRPWRALVVYPIAPANKRGGYVLPIEEDRWMVTLFGWLHDHAPANEAGFRDFAASLPVPDALAVIDDCEPLGDFVVHKFPSDRRRYYERLSRFPDGFVVMGDAVCSMNPVYGQGMTCAALEACLLRDLLQQQQQSSAHSLIGLAPRFQKALGKIVALPWLIAISEDLRFPATQGPRPRIIPLLNWYTRQVLDLTATDQQVAMTFTEVLHMVKTPLALAQPRILLKILFKPRPPRHPQTTTPIEQKQPLTV